MILFQKISIQIIRLLSEIKGNPNQIQKKISDIFNLHFTNIVSCSNKSNTDYDAFNYNLFNKFISKTLLNLNKFMFRPISEYIVGKLLAKLDNSTGAGVTGISTKILKESAIKLL